MGRSPRIGREVVAEQQANEILAEQQKQKDAEVRALAERSVAENKRMLEESRAVEVPKKTAGPLAALADKGRDMGAATRAQLHRAVEEEVQPLLAEAQSLLTKHGLLRSKHLDYISEVSNTRWADVLRVVPEDLKMVDREMRSLPHEAVKRLRQAALDALPPLRSSFGDSMPGPNDLDPVSLQAAVNEVKTALQSGDVRDERTGEIKQAFRRSLSHLHTWLARARNTVTATERLVAEFYKAEAQAAPYLAPVDVSAPVVDVAPAHLDVAPETRQLGTPHTVAPVNRPPRQQSSFTEFDPRS